MKTRMLLMMLMLLGLVHQGRSQGGIYHVEGLHTKGSIVRAYNAKQAVAYVDASADRGFCLLDFGEMTATYAELPSGVVVNDFEVLQGKVYFCGTYGGIPYVGHFKVEPLFGGTDDYYYHRLNVSNPTYEIVNPERLDVYLVGGEEHAVMVGEGRRLMPSGVTAERFVMDVCHDTTNPTWITGQVVFNESSPDHFYDIATTDHYVVTVEGKEPGGNAHYMRAFDKPTAAGDYIFNTGTWHAYYHSQGGYYPVSGLMVTHLTGDRYATVSYSERGGRFGAAISVFQAPMTLLDRELLDQGTTATAGCELRGVAYTPANSTLTVLQAMESPVSASAVSAMCQLDATNNAVAYHNDEYDLHSVCAWTNDGSVLATGAGSNGFLSACWLQPMVRSCQERTPLNADPLQSDDGSDVRFWNPSNFLGTVVVATSPTITTYNIIEDCR